MRVSILTRPEERVLRSAGQRAEPKRRKFQSSPALKSGCYLSASGHHMGEPRSGVSILTRPEERVLQLDGETRVFCPDCFNPHPP